ncbi:MAG: FG-GAP-like repeat-containing protein [Mangrovibacterium sp.]
MKKVYLNILWGLLYLVISLTGLAQPADLILSSPESGTKLHQATNSITFNPVYSYTPDGGNLTAEIVPFTLSPGIIDADLNVSPTGAAVYEVPIKLPPGTAGMTPGLSFMYNSQGENGLLGVGWTISGSSAITRASSTFYHDELIKTVTLDLQDRFMLDGQRLILVSGTYGADGSEYRTENNEFSRIIAYGGSGTGPEKFKVWTKSGLIREYGYTTDSRIEAQGSTAVLYWQLNKVTDSKGNYINFLYTENNANGEFRPLRIEYTGNSSAGLTPYCKVEFVYESRTDQTAIYLAGSLSKVTQRLKEVVAYYNNMICKRYALSYAYLGETARSHVTAIREYGTDNVHAYKPLEFDWQEEIPGMANFNYDQSYYATHYATHNCQFYLGDFNGDGRTDAVTVPIKNFPDDPATWTGFRLFLANEEGNALEYESSAAYTYNFDLQNILVGDYNGDGKSDIVIQSTYSGNNAYYSYMLFKAQEDQYGNISLYHTPNEFIKIIAKDHEHEMLTGDFNGDGISDLYLRDDESAYNQFLLGTSDGLFVEHSHFASGTGKVKVYGDYNGDGISDFVLFNGPSCFIFNVELTQGSLYTPDFESLSGSWSFAFPSDNIYKFGDFNADGKTDLIAFGKEGDQAWTNWSIWFADGKRSVKVDFPSKRDIREDIIEVHDFNADGRSDILVIAGDNSGWEGRALYLADNAGTDFVQADEGPIYPSAGQRFYFGDINGDGATDFFIVDNELGEATAYWHGYQLYHKGRQIRDLMTTVTDGLGLQLKMTYKPITNNSVYTRSNIAAYPVSGIEAAYFVVDSVLRETGSGNFLSTTYHYFGAFVHKLGKGFLGFQQTEEKDNSTGIKTIRQFDFDNPYFNPELRTVQQIRTGDVLIGNTGYTYGYKTVPGTKIFFPYVSESTVEYRELNGVLYNTVVTGFTYDDYGNVLTTAADYNNGFATETSVNQYDNTITTDKWFLGRLRRSTVTKTRESKPAVTRVSAFDYNSVSGLLEKEIVEPDNPTYRYEKGYSHDAFGNIIETRYKRTGMADRFTSSVYDSKGRFETSTQNALGHTTTKDYDDYFGNVISMISPNNLETQYFYDEFGNMTRTLAPDGNEVVSSTHWVVETDPDAPAGAIYYSRTQASGGPAGIEYYDQQGRTMRKVTTGFEEAVIYADTRYNLPGQVEKVSEPYFKVGGTPLWKEYEYDLLGRVTEVTLPGNRITTTVYGGLTTTVTGPLNKTMAQTTDVLGNLVESKDHNLQTVTYDYFSSGLVKEVTAPGSAYNILMEYDLLGNQTLLDDPNLGAIHYQYNVYGELVSQTDAIHTTSLEYDLLGRMTRRTSTEGTTNWIYDTDFIGNLSWVRGPGGVSQSYLYDAYGRIETGIDTIAGTRYTTQHTYDSYGREDQLTYPSGFAVRNVYDTNGYLTEIRRVSDSQVLWVAQEANARGQLTQMLLGNGLVTEKTFNPNTGFIENIHTGTIQNMGFQWDARGNLLQRSNSLKSRTEDFTYDNLDRLETSTVNGYPTISVDYDALGNITSKSDVATGTFTYGLNAGPNALTRVNGNTGAISTVAQDIDYSSFNKVTRIAEGSNEVQFTYGPEYARKIMRRYENNTLVLTKTYVGLYEKEVSGTNVKEIHYLNGGDGLFAIYTRVNQTSGSIAYVLKDHLGSIQCLTNEAGALTEELSFDAWGRRRDPNTWQPLPMGGSYQTSLGFTSHEHIDIAALVNMEGRLYDPVVGRFLSADPFMQAPDYTQGLNRYSYCLNNPLSLIDPSGYSWLSRNWKSLVAGIVAITVTVVTAGTGTVLFGQAVLSGALGGFAGGFTGALLNGGNIVDAFKAGVIGGVIGGLAGGGANLIGNAAQGLGSFQKELARSLAHGSLGGVTSLAQGGKFKHGFFSGMFASMAGSGMEASGWGVFSTDVGSVVTAAVVGGTASGLGGGKFANGAVTGAYTMLFNHMAHRPEDPPVVETGEGYTTYEDLQQVLSDIYHGKIPEGTDITGLIKLKNPKYQHTSVGNLQTANIGDAYIAINLEEGYVPTFLRYYAEGGPNLSKQIFRFAKGNLIKANYPSKNIFGKIVSKPYAIRIEGYFGERPTVIGTIRFSDWDAFYKFNMNIY